MIHTRGKKDSLSHKNPGKNIFLERNDSQGALERKHVQHCNQQNPTTQKEGESKDQTLNQPTLHEVASLL